MPATVTVIEHPDRDPTPPGANPSWPCVEWAPPADGRPAELRAYLQGRCFVITGDPAEESP